MIRETPIVHGFGAHQTLGMVVADRKKNEDSPGNLAYIRIISLPCKNVTM